MIKLHYQHPPRKWDFYAGYLLTLLLITLPILLNLLAWQATLSFLINIALSLFFSFWWLLFIAYESLQHHVIFYDRFLPRERPIDLSDKRTPNVIQAAIEDVRDLGFLRFGEEVAYVGLSDKPVYVWLMTSPGNEITFEVLELSGVVEKINIMAQFSTWFEGHRLVETSYPLGDIIETENYRSEGIGSSIEDAYHYHLRQIAQFEARYGAPVKVRSHEQYASLGPIHRRTHGARRMLYPTVRFFVVNGLLNLCLSSLVYMTIGSLLAAFFPGKESVMSPLLMSAAYLLISAIGLTWALNVKGRNLSKSKKQEAKAQ